MNRDDPYKAWKTRRSQVHVDDRFADQVMERIGQAEWTGQDRTPVVVKRGVYRFARFAQVAATVLVVGLGVGILRTGSVIVFLLLSASKGY